MSDYFDNKLVFAVRMSVQLFLVFLPTFRSGFSLFLSLYRRACACLHPRRFSSVNLIKVLGVAPSKYDIIMLWSVLSNPPCLKKQNIIVKNSRRQSLYRCKSRMWKGRALITCLSSSSCQTASSRLQLVSRPLVTGGLTLLPMTCVV